MSDPTSRNAEKAPGQAPENPGVSTESGLPFEGVYGPGALDGFDPAAQLGEPGSFPFTRLST